MTWVIQNCIHLRFFHPQKGYTICWIDNQDPEYNKSLQQLNYHLDWPVLIIAQAEAVLDILTEKVLWACLALKKMHFTQEIKHTILLGQVNVEKLVSDHPHPSPYYWPLLTPLVQISFSTQPDYCHFSKMTVIISTKKILRTCSPKLCLLCRLLCTMRAVWLNIPGNLTNVRLIQYCWPKTRGVWVHNGARLTTFRGARELALDLQDRVFISSSSSSVYKFACTNFYSSVIIARFIVMQLIPPVDRSSLCTRRTMLGYACIHPIECKCFLSVSLGRQEQRLKIGVLCRGEENRNKRSKE